MFLPHRLLTTIWKLWGHWEHGTYTQLFGIQWTGNCPLLTLPWQHYSKITLHCPEKLRSRWQNLLDYEMNFQPHLLLYQWMSSTRCCLFFNKQHLNIVNIFIIRLWGCHFFLPLYKNKQIEKEVSEAMMKSLKYCDVDSVSARQPLCQYRAATIHHRLASMYHSCLRNQVTLSQDSSVPGPFKSVHGVFLMCSCLL
jgi:hypothetical protein